jgi:hypothetical protein
LLWFKTLFGGNIYHDNGRYSSYKWSIQSQADILFFTKYLINIPCLSHKIVRLGLVSTYYDLHALKAYKALPGSDLHGT